jgi:hypothetical protein
MFRNKSSVFLLSCIALPLSIAFTYSQGIAATPGKLRPLSVKACNTLQADLASVLGKKTRQVFVNTNAPFENQISKVKGTACQLTVSSTGKSFKSIADIATPITAMLTKQGWKEDPAYAADGPEGKITAFRKSNDLSVLDIKSSLLKSVKCPNNTPVTTCYQQAKSEQIMYNVTLSSAHTGK